jgi:hypothetical protein
MSQIELNKKEKNKELVLEAFDALFNQRDYIAAERYCSQRVAFPCGPPECLGEIEIGV